MKVIIDGKKCELSEGVRSGDHFQHNEIVNNKPVRAHNFKTNLKRYPKETDLKTNGHIYRILSK